MTQSQHLQDESTQRHDEGLEGDLSAASPVVAPTPRAPQPIFAIVNAPLIADISREALLEWTKLRKEYVAVTEARCKSANEDVSAVLRSVRNSFDQNLLETMCETRWDVDIDDLTDQFLMDKIKEITASFKNRELPDMEDLFSDELKLDLTISDVEARVTKYFHLANEIIKRNGVSDLFLGDDGVKRKCKVLVRFSPGYLKKKVTNELEYRSGEAKTSVRKLYKVVNNLALEVEKETRAMRKVRARNTKPSKPFSTRGSMKVFSKKTAEVAGGTAGVKRMAETRSRAVETHKAARPSNTRKCFHCEGEHEFINCPTATESDKAAIRAKRREEYQARQKSARQQRRHN